MLIAPLDTHRVLPRGRDLHRLHVKVDVLLVVGAERHRVSEEVLAATDAIVRLPMNGFVPSYNLQVAVSVLAVEALRQRQKREN